MLQSLVTPSPSSSTSERSESRPAAAALFAAAAVPPLLAEAAAAALLAAAASALFTLADWATPTAGALAFPGGGVAGGASAAGGGASAAAAAAAAGSPAGSPPRWFLSLAPGNVSPWFFMQVCSSFIEDMSWGQVHSYPVNRLISAGPLRLSFSHAVLGLCLLTRSSTHSVSRLQPISRPAMRDRKGFLRADAYL